MQVKHNIRFNRNIKFRKPTITFYGTYSKSKVFKHKNLQMQPEKHVSDNSIWESNTKDKFLIIPQHTLNC